jgi:hypothetical protein
MSVTQAVEASKIEAIPAPFPETKGIATLKVLNSEESLGPAVALLRMEPGSEIPRHLHERTTEMSYVLDGDFIKRRHLVSEGHRNQYQAKYHSRPPHDEDRMLRPSHVQLSIRSR